MQCSTVLRVALLLSCFCCDLSAQTKPAETPPLQAQPLPIKPLKKVPPKPKLTPQQEQGFRMLKSVQGEAAGLEAVTRSYMLWKISHGYRKADPVKADTTLRRAFFATRGIQDNVLSDGCRMPLVCDMQGWMQSSILIEMLTGHDKGSPERVEKLLQQAIPEVKQRMLTELAKEYLRKQNFGRVRELMDEIDPDNYLFSLAGELMAAFPASRHDDFISIFSQAFQNFRNRSLDDVAPDSYEDFAVLVVRFWRDLPPSLALESANAVLERAKDRDDSKKTHNVSMSLMNGSSMPFESEYEFRLFELLPILKELDPSQADKLLDEHDKARAALDRYPKGMQSLDSNYYGDKPLDQKAMPAVIDVTPALDDDPVKNSEYQGQMQLNDQLLAQMNAITDEMEKDPDKAYQDAMNLPAHGAFDMKGCPRATGLRRVALGIVKKNPTLARTAMNEARRLAQDLEPARQALILAEVPDFYLELGDEDGARSAIKDQMKLAEKLYAIDTNSDDPNLAFKGAWPSTNAWRNCIEHATKVSPAFAEELLAQIPDPDIVGLQRVMYANALLGTEHSSVEIVEWHKSGKQSGMFMSR